MKKVIYTLVFLLISNMALAQSTSICSEILKWQATQGIPFAVNRTAEYIVTINGLSPKNYFQKIITLNASRDGMMEQTSQCLLLDHLFRTKSPLSMEVSYRYKLPNSSSYIKLPVLMIHNNFGN
ncbi:MAG: hypothetical protein P1U34_09065 [Coxiellaceae bacterium]|nr:hypothetical protein [Coxiellaceae bacterium]